MITVYAIYSENVDQIYVGLTNDLQRRLNEHRRGHSRSTKRFKCIRVVHTEEFSDYAAARVREKSLKTGHGKRFLREFI